MATGHEHDITTPNFSAGEPPAGGHDHEDSKMKYWVGGGILLAVIVVAAYLISALLGAKKPAPPPAAPPPAIKPASPQPPAPIHQKPSPVTTAPEMTPPPPPVVEKTPPLPAAVAPVVKVEKPAALAKTPPAESQQVTAKTPAKPAAVHPGAHRKKLRHAVYFLQLGAFRRPEHAAHLCKTIEPVGFPCYFGTVRVKGERFYRLRAGPFDSTKAAQAAAAKFKHHGFSSRLITLPAHQVKPSIPLPKTAASTG